MQWRDMPVFSSAAWLAAQQNQQDPHDWPPMLPASPRGLSPLPIDVSPEDEHQARALAARKLQAAHPGAARSSALQGDRDAQARSDDKAAAASASRKRKAQGQDPDEEIGMPTAEELAAASHPATVDLDKAAAKARDRQMWERLSHSLRPQLSTWLPRRLTEILRASSRLDQPNAEVMYVLAMDARGPRMSVPDFEALLRLIVSLRDATGRPLDIPLLELCHGLAKALHAPGLHPAHGEAIERVLAASDLGPAQRAAAREVMHLRMRPCEAPGRPGEHKALPIHEARMDALAGPEEGSLVDALVEEILDMDLDRLGEQWRSVTNPNAPGPSASRQRATLMRRPSDLLEDAIRRWLAPFRGAGQASRDRAVAGAIDALCQQGHRLGPQARHAMRFLVDQAGGPLMPAQQFRKLLGQIIDHQAAWEPDPLGPAPQAGESFSPLENLAWGLGQGVSESQRADGLPVLTTNKGRAARELLRERPGLQPAQAQRLAQLLGLREAPAERPTREA